MPHFVPVGAGRIPMPSRAEVLGNRTIGGEESLGMPWRLEPLHPPLALACGLVGIFCTVVEVAVLPVFYARQAFALSSVVAF